MRLPRIVWFSFYTSIYHVRYLSVCWSFFYQIDTNLLILNSFFTSSINNCETGVFTSLVLQWLREVVLTCMWEISFFNQSLQLYCKCKVEISFDFFFPFFLVELNPCMMLNGIELKNKKIFAVCSIWKKKNYSEKKLK